MELITILNRPGIPWVTLCCRIRPAANKDVLTRFEYGGDYMGLAVTGESSDQRLE